MAALLHCGQVLGGTSTLHGITVLKNFRYCVFEQEPSHCIQGWKESALRKHQFIERETFYRDRSGPGKLVCLVQDGIEPGKTFLR